MKKERPKAKREMANKESPDDISDGVPRDSIFDDDGETHTDVILVENWSQDQ